MHDAMGSPQGNGETPVLLNDIIELFDSNGEGPFPRAEAEGVRGHSPRQVIAGAALGISVALILKL
jgi:acid phosphatase family membrane protein YuiD